MSEFTVTTTAYGPRALLIERITTSNTVAGLDALRRLEADNRVAYVTVTPARVADIERVGTLFRTSEDTSADLVTYSRLDPSDPRLDLPEFGTIADLEGLTDAIKAVGIDAELEHPGVIVARVGDTTIGLDSDGEYRVGVYSHRGYERGEDSDTGLTAFPPTMAGRRAALAHFLLSANAAKQAVPDCAAEASNAAADGVLDAAGHVTHEGITTTIDGTIVAVDGSRVITPDADAVRADALAGLINDLDLDIDGLRTMQATIKGRDYAGGLTDDERRYLDGILVPMARRMLEYLRVTAEAQF